MSPIDTGNEPGGWGGGLLPFEFAGGSTSGSCWYAAGEGLASRDSIWDREQISGYELGGDCA